MTRVGIIGCGTIGTALAHALERDYHSHAKIVAIADREPAAARTLQRRLTAHPAIVSIPDVIRRSQLVIEAAAVSVAARVAQLALAADRDVLIMSSGGLLAGTAWQRAAARSRGHLYVPSGGLCGLDGVKAFAVGTIRRIRLTTRKPPRGLLSAPFVQRKRFALARLTGPRTIFEGSPQQAIRAFPQNTNVAATMLLAALTGRRRVAARVRVVADPTITRNIHELEIEGDCGRLQCRMESRPSALNPKTSEIAVRSALATLRQLFDPVRIGT